MVNWLEGTFVLAGKPRIASNWVANASTSDDGVLTLELICPLTSVANTVELRLLTIRSGACIASSHDCLLHRLREMELRSMALGGGIGGFAGASGGLTVGIGTA